MSRFGFLQQELAVIHERIHSRGGNTCPAHSASLRDSHPRRRRKEYQHRWKRQTLYFRSPSVAAQTLPQDRAALLWTCQLALLFDTQSKLDSLGLVCGGDPEQSVSPVGTATGRAKSTPVISQNE